MCHEPKHADACHAGIHEWGVTAAFTIRGKGKGKGKGDANWTVYMQAIINETNLAGEVETEATGGMSRTLLVTARGHPVVTTEYEVTASLNAGSETLVVNVTETEQPDDEQDPRPPSPPHDSGPDDAEDRGHEFNPNDH